MGKTRETWEILSGTIWAIILAALAPTPRNIGVCRASVFAFIYGLLSFCFPDTMRASVSVSLSISLSRSLCHSLCLCLCLLSLNNSRLLFGIFSALCSLTHTSLTYTLQSAIDRVKRDARCSMLTKSKRVCFMSVLRFCLGSTGSGWASQGSTQSLYASCH